MSLQLSARRLYNDAPPKALLIELLTRQNQLTYLRAHKPEQVKEVEGDIRSVMQATVKDFSHNFDFCPVYFFLDTNADQIKNGHFTGVLLDGNMQPVAQSVLKDGDTSVFIAYYGGRIPQPENSRTTEDNNSNLGFNRESSGDTPTGHSPTLIVLDHNFRLLTLPRPRTVRGYVGRTKRRFSEYNYRSKTYEIDYSPVASSYDATIEFYYKGIKRRQLRIANRD